MPVLAGLPVAPAPAALPASPCRAAWRWRGRPPRLAPCWRWRFPVSCPPVGAWWRSVAAGAAVLRSRAGARLRPLVALAASPRRVAGGLSLAAGRRALPPPRWPVQAGRCWPASGFFLPLAGSGALCTAPAFGASLSPAFGFSASGPAFLAVFSWKNLAFQPLYIFSLFDKIYFNF